MSNACPVSIWLSINTFSLSVAVRLSYRAIMSVFHAPTWGMALAVYLPAQMVWWERMVLSSLNTQTDWATVSHAISTAHKGELDVCLLKT